MIEGKIYKIKNKDFPGMFYYGSTTQTLNKRINIYQILLMQKNFIIKDYLVEKIIKKI